MRSRGLLVALLVLTLVVGLSGSAGAAPANDDFASATPVSTLPFQATGSTVGATLEKKEPQPSCGAIGATVWYRLTPAADATIVATTDGSSFDTILAVYVGDRLSQLTEIACGDDAGGSKQSVVAFAAVAGESYDLQVGGFGGKVGSLTLTLRIPAPGDDFEAAIEVPALPFSDSRNTDTATTQSGEPTPCGPGGRSVWYRFTPGEDVGVRVDTFTSDFDTVLAVYTGTSLSDLAFVTCNDQFGGDQSQVAFAATAGVTYYIQAYGWVGSSGALVLHIAGFLPPPNDDFSAAVEIPALPYTTGLSTLGASLEPGEPLACGNSGTVWYRFTPSADTLIETDTLGSDFDTVLAVYTGSDLGNLELVVCSDDFLFSQSLVTFPATAGETYFIQAGGWFGAIGNLSLAIRGLV